jgi:hypothetical protein
MKVNAGDVFRAPAIGPDYSAPKAATSWHSDGTRDETVGSVNWRRAQAIAP